MGEGEKLNKSVRSNDAMIADPLRLYIEDISRHDLLTAEDEVRLGTVVQDGLRAEQQLIGAYTFKALRRLTGDPIDYEIPENDALVGRVADGREAHTEFTNSNLRLVVSIAKKFHGNSMTTLDHIQNGNLGLMHAINKFDPTTGYKFSTYGTWWIRQSIQRGIADQDRTVRIPVHTLDEMKRLHTIKTEHMNSNRGDVPVVVLAREAGLELQRVYELEDATTVTASLDQPSGEDGKRTLGDIVANDDSVDATESRIDPQEVLGLLTNLNSVERTVIVHSFGLEGEPRLSNKKIGTVIGKSSETAAKIRRGALAKMLPAAKHVMGQIDDDFVVEVPIITQKPNLSTQTHPDIIDSSA